MKDADVACALLDGLRAASEVLLMDATTPWELDEAMTAHGFAMGVCEAQDQEGLDVGLARHASQRPDARGRTIPILPRMVSEGRLGRKVDVGWYRYPGGGGLVIDPLVEDLLREEAWFAGVTRRDLREADLFDQVTMGVFEVRACASRAWCRARAHRPHQCCVNRFSDRTGWGVKLGAIPGAEQRDGVF